MTLSEYVKSLCEDTGQWVTIRGTHVFIGSDGIISKGPKFAMGKHISDFKGDEPKPNLSQELSGKITASVKSPIVKHEAFTNNNISHSQRMSIKPTLNPVALVKIEDDGQGVWKPMRASVTQWRYLNLTDSSMGDREVMASKVCDLLGEEFAGIVPKTVVKHLPDSAKDEDYARFGLEGSCQLHVDDLLLAEKKCDYDTKYESNIKKELRVELKKVPKEEILRVAGFDDLIGGNDRHEANWGFSNGKLVFIDNGISFGMHVKAPELAFLNQNWDFFKGNMAVLKTKDYQLPFKRAKENEDKLNAIFKEHKLSKMEIDAFWTRVNKVITGGILY
jgi:hypothetical protein